MRPSKLRSPSSRNALKARSASFQEPLVRSTGRRCSHTELCCARGLYSLVLFPAPARMPSDSTQPIAAQSTFPNCMGNSALALPPGCMLCVMGLPESMGDSLPSEGRICQAREGQHWQQGASVPLFSSPRDPATLCCAQWIRCQRCRSCAGRSWVALWPWCHL